MNTEEMREQEAPMLPPGKYLAQKWKDDDGNIFIVPDRQALFNTEEELQEAFQGRNPMAKLKSLFHIANIEPEGVLEFETDGDQTNVMVVNALLFPIGPVAIIEGPKFNEALEREKEDATVN